MPRACLACVIFRQSDSGLRMEKTVDAFVLVAFGAVFRALNEILINNPRWGCFSVWRSHVVKGFTTVVSGCAVADTCQIA